MDAERTQQAGSQAGIHLVLYDGVCGLCDRLVGLLLRHDHRAVFRFAALQSPLGRRVIEQVGGNLADLSSFYVVANFRTARIEAFTKSRAALFVADELGWPWRAARVFRVVPRAIRDRAYDAVARIRYRAFGRYDRCAVPSPEFRARFIDEQR